MFKLYKKNISLCVGSGSLAFAYFAYKHLKQNLDNEPFENAGKLKSLFRTVLSSLPSALEFPKLQALKYFPNRPTEDHVLRGLKLNHRERRFMKFASVEYHGQLYLTPQDFIESVTDSEPRPRLKRRVLNDGDVDNFLSSTTPMSKGTPHMFRSIYDKEPQTGFRIAFNMFDTDGNQRVDKEEFMVILFLLNAAAYTDFKAWMTKAPDYLPKGHEDKVQETVNAVSRAFFGPTKGDIRMLEKIFSTARKDKLHRAMEGVAESSHSEGLDRGSSVAGDFHNDHLTDTTLMVHFFGKSGRQSLKFEHFKKFMENLQTEVLEIEFNEFSKGLPTISELDFAKILLRYTYLSSDQYEMYLERLLDRLPEEKGITFCEFKSFCQFLNNLDDFAIAMKMYTLADQPISQDEFHRAVKICTGQSLSAHIVDTVFKIFDDDGDGQLSYKEFIAIMRNRLHRGFKHNLRSEGWDAFKHCIKIEMKTNV